MNTNNISKLLDDNKILIHLEMQNKFLQKISDTTYGFFDRNSKLIEEINDLNTLPKIGWLVYNEEEEKLKYLKIGRICQSFD